MSQSEEAWINLRKAAELSRTEANERLRPSILYRPNLGYSPEFGGWLATYGGFGAFGRTPEEAMRTFDNYWYNPDNREMDHA